MGILVNVHSTDNYEVAGISCAPNEEVSCLMVKCPSGRNCPAEDFCYNPKCVCRRGYRKIGSDCVPKQRTHKLIKEEV